MYLCAFRALRVRVRTVISAYTLARVLDVVREYFSGGALEANSPERYDQVETHVCPFGCVSSCIPLCT